ncbi:MAG TPA: hypothetical protein VEG38_05635 [Acidimicrobiia bacterium]|nr:hypothetical protein [Acidimicrobiia bacterium]
MGSNVLYELAGHVATITYNRPEALNAIDADLRVAQRRLRPLPRRAGPPGKAARRPGRGA